MLYKILPYLDPTNQILTFTSISILRDGRARNVYDMRKIFPFLYLPFFMLSTNQRRLILYRQATLPPKDIYIYIWGGGGNKSQNIDNPLTHIYIYIYISFGGNVVCRYNIKRRWLVDWLKSRKYRKGFAVSTIRWAVLPYPNHNCHGKTEMQASAVRKMMNWHVN